MDSMRSLNSSLPSSRPNRSAPPEELLQAFRTAALSVTNLYKSAATSQASARQAGYQDALEDILQFLDNENLGLQDGEGWRVRQWATARYDGSTSRPEQSEDEEDDESSDIRHRDISQGREGQSHAHENAVEATDAHRSNPEASSDSAGQTPIFQFTSNGHPESTMQTDGQNLPQSTEDPSLSPPNAPIRVEVLNRNNKPISRPQHSRHSNRSNPRDFTFTAGSKRKLQFPDFFDISNFTDKADGSGGGGGGGGGSKRGRLA